MNFSKKYEEFDFCEHNFSGSTNDLNFKLACEVYVLQGQCHQIFFL